MNSAPTGIAEQTAPDAKEPSAHRIPELLAPAGDWECAKAAVENGADAIYFGLEKFNARMRAHNFTEADLPKLMEFLHLRGVKGYVTFNTLIFENEMAEAEQYLRTIIASGVDAAIVQDVGICRLIRALSPDFPIHVSTQMTITSAGGVEFAKELGCNLVVLARECSLKEIDKMCRGSHAIGERPSPGAAALVAPAISDSSTWSGQAEIAAPGDGRSPTLPLEVFVHGALCVAYSGQCLTSEALGGRSANRGECAQACRMPYELIADGKQVDLGDRRYLLSPQDLAGLEVLPKLVRLGVASLKIEGRLKSPEYVANITRIYRKALDRILRGSAEIPSSRNSRRKEALIISEPAQQGNMEPPPTRGPRGDAYVGCYDNYEMEMAFSRGLSTGWFRGIDNQKLVHARFGKKRGVYLGEVAGIDGERVRVKLEAPLKAGDGIVFDAGRPEEKEEGARVYEVKNGHGLSTLTFGRGDIDFNKVHVGDKIWKTSDPELERRLRQSFEGDGPRFQRPISMEVHGLEGKPMSLIARDEVGNVVRIESSMPLTRAERQPLTTERLREQLGRLGGTALILGELKNLLEGEVILPVSELNRMRRETVQELERLRARPKRWALRADNLKLLPALREAESGTGLPHSKTSRTEQGAREGASVLECGSPMPLFAEAKTRQRSEATAAQGKRNRYELIVLARSMGQLGAALESDVRTVYCEFENPKRYGDAVELVRKTAAGTAEIFVAPPRIFKMGEEWTLKQVRSCEADGYLVRNYDHLNFFANDRRVGDFSLNVANRLTADYFKNKFGLERVTASYDLNFAQLEALLEAAPPEWFEVTIHQHIPMFHMEHCVFCAFLSNGTDYTNCGRPCDKHDLKLRDRVGAQHPVKADVGCRNTVFNALAQTGAEYVSRMLDLGVRHFRLEFLNESAEQVTKTIAKYRQLLEGKITGQQLWRELKLLNQLGVTRGQMGEKNRY
jgi:putative protease